LQLASESRPIHAFNYAIIIHPVSMPLANAYRYAALSWDQSSRMTPGKALPQDVLVAERLSIAKCSDSLKGGG